MNAVGNGVADDKARLSLRARHDPLLPGEEPLLRQVDTYVCARDDDRRYVLEHLAELVVKPVNEAGGYGMLMGPRPRARSAPSSRSASRPIRASYIAQHRIELSSCPTWTGEGAWSRGASICGPSS